MKKFIVFFAAVAAVAMLFTVACSTAAAKSDKTDITALTVTVNSTDYTVNFNGIAASVLIPATQTVPGSITVKSVTLATGASGLTVGQVLTLSGGSVELTVTAEDGTTKTTYTIMVAQRVDITALTVTVNSTDYTVNFNGVSAFVIIPQVQTVPGSITVKSVTLAAGASGLTVGQVLTLSSGSVELTVTAEDGTEIVYTLLVAKQFAVAEVSRATGGVRWNYVLFNIASGDGTSNLGRHKLVLKAESEAAPSAQDIIDGAGVHRVINATEKTVLLAYTLDSTIANTIATGSKYLGRLVKDGDKEDPNDATNTNTLDVDNLVLDLNTAYTLYALKEGDTADDKVVELGDFSTDALNTSMTVTANTALDTSLNSVTITYNEDDALFVAPVQAALLDGSFEGYTFGAESADTGTVIVFISFNFDSQSFVAASWIYNSAVAIIAPSQFINGGNPNISMSSISVINWIGILPINQLDGRPKVHFTHFGNRLWSSKLAAED